jgi:CRISPR-associated protein Csx3
MINFNIEERQDFTIVTFAFEGSLEPSILKGLQVPPVAFNKGVVISGRGPVWLFAYIAHEYHPAAWVATFDPRLGGIIVESHTPGINAGEIVSI